MLYVVPHWKYVRHFKLASPGKFVPGSNTLGFKYSYQPLDFRKL